MLTRPGSPHCSRSRARTPAVHARNRHRPILTRACVPMCAGTTERGASEPSDVSSITTVQEIASAIIAAASELCGDRPCHPSVVRAECNKSNPCVCAAMRMPWRAGSLAYVPPPPHPDRLGHARKHCGCFRQLGESHRSAPPAAHAGGRDGRCCARALPQAHAGGRREQCHLWQCGPRAWAAQECGGRRLGGRRSPSSAQRQLLCQVPVGVAAVRCGCHQIAAVWAPRRLGGGFRRVGGGVWSCQRRLGRRVGVSGLGGVAHARGCVRMHIYHMCLR